VVFSKECRGAGGDRSGHDNRQNLGEMVVIKTTRLQKGGCRLIEKHPEKTSKSFRRKKAAK